VTFPKPDPDALKFLEYFALTFVAVLLLAFGVMRNDRKLRGSISDQNDEDEDGDETENEEEDAQ
jgi:hypothetical protein